MVATVAHLANMLNMLNWIANAEWLPKWLWVLPESPKLLLMIHQHRYNHQEHQKHHQVHTYLFSLCQAATWMYLSSNCIVHGSGLHAWHPTWNNKLLDASATKLCSRGIARIQCRKLWKQPLSWLLQLIAARLSMYQIPLCNKYPRLPSPNPRSLCCLGILCDFQILCYDQYGVLPALIRRFVTMGRTYC